MRVSRWQPLGKGAIALVAPGSPVTAAALDAAVSAVGAAGREAVVLGDVTSPAPARERAEALVSALEDAGVAGIAALRGGWGSAELLPLLAGVPVRKLAKPLLGYSDITSLQLAFAGAGLVTFHGPMPAEPEATRAPVGSFGDLLSRLAEPPPWSLAIPGDAAVRREGSCRGRLLGGNLTTLCHLVGTPHLPRTAGAVLFLEEIAEAPYRVARMMTHLALAGILDGLSGLLIGSLGVEPEPLLPLLLERVRGPIVTGLPIGHLRGQWILPTGATAAVDTGAGEIVFRER